MKMSLDFLVPSTNPEVEKLNETLRLLAQVSLSLQPSSRRGSSVDDGPGTKQPSTPMLPTPDASPLQPNAVYSRVRKIRRVNSGRVVKKTVNE